MVTILRELEKHRLMKSQDRKRGKKFCSYPQEKECKKADGGIQEADEEFFEEGDELSYLCYTCIRLSNWL
jgi:hypothetical protein